MDNQIKPQEPNIQTPIPQQPINNEEPMLKESIPQRPPIEETPILKTQTPIINSEPVQTIPVQPDANTSLNEYQQILDQYTANLQSQPQPEIQTEAQAPIIETPIQSQPIEQNQPVEQVQSPIIENSPRSSEEQLQDLGISPPVETGNSFFKILFIISLIIFILVAGALAFVYSKSQKTQSSSNSSNLNNIQTSPTPVSSALCSLNDKTYKVGESFPSADGCNTCSCQSSNAIVCTEMACASSPTPSATKSATKLTVTPTKTATSSVKKTTPTATPSSTIK